MVRRGRLPITLVFNLFNRLSLNTFCRLIAVPVISEEMSTYEWRAIKVWYRGVAVNWKCLVSWGFAQDRTYPTRSWVGNLAGISPEQRHSLKPCISKAVYYCMHCFVWVKEAACAPRSSVLYGTHSLVKYFCKAYAAIESREWSAFD